MTTMERAAWDAVYEWMREPDHVESASLEWLTDWINRRPIMHLVQCQPDNPNGRM